MSASVSSSSAAALSKDTSKNGLGGFLDNGQTTAPVAKEESEIYIRADGKKVRRIRKTVVRTVSASSTASNKKSNEDRESALGRLLGKPGAPSKKASGSATVAGSSPAKSKTYADGEVYTRPDGKRVRRVKRTVSSSQSAAGDLATSVGPKKKKDLSGLLDDNSSTSATPRKNSGAATVDGSSGASAGEIYTRPDGKRVRRVKRNVARSTSAMDAPKKNSGAASLSGLPSKAGEVYINKDGKKVRRVKRSSSASVTGTPSSSASSVSGGTKTGGLTGFLGKLGPSRGNKASGSATVAGDTPSKQSKSTTYAEGETYVRPDGKRVRRVKKNSAAGNKSPAGDLATASLSGAATVSGAPQEGEIYINKDGKKVRRVRKTLARSNSNVETSTAGKSLSALVGSGTASKKSGAASVSGLSSSRGEGEIYINKDGKKVRRVKRSASSAASTSSAANTKTSGLGALLGSAAKPSKASGSATVAGDRPSKSKTFTEGEVYVRADGKRVRRVKRTASKTASPNKAGDLAGADGLNGFLNNTGGGAKAKMSGSATVAGDRVAPARTDSKTAVAGAGEIVIRPDGKKVIRRKKNAEGGKAPETEVYRRADGKLVRRVKRTASAAATTNQKAKPGSAAGDLAGFLGPKGKEEAAKTPQNSGSATVAVGAAASAAAPTIAELLQSNAPVTTSSQPPAPPTTPASLSENSGNQKESASQLSVEEEATVSSYRKMKKMGLPDDAIRHKMEQDGVESRLIDAVCLESALSTNDAPKPAVPRTTAPVPAVVPTPDAPAPVVAVASTPSAPATVAPTEPVTSALNPGSLPHQETLAKPSALLSEEEATVLPYRKMKNMGLPDDALRHKMEQDGLEPRLIAFVVPENDSQSTPALSTQTSGAPETVPKAAPLSPPAPHPASPSVQLSAEEAAVAKPYQKMKTMGLPDDAVRHKMQQDRVEENIIASVLGNPWHDSALASTAQTPATRAPAQKPALPTAIPADQLSTEEEALATPYIKMKKMGLPDDAVHHKMQQDGVEAKIIASVLGKPSTSSSTASTPATAQTPISQLAPEPEPPAVQLSGEEEATAEPYQKMKKMGLPDDAVRHKMQQDGIEAKIIASVLGDPWNGSASTNVASTSLPPPQTTVSPALSESLAPSVRLSQEEEVMVTPYRKMQKMGLPDDAVRHKMQQDGVESRLIAAVFGEPDGDKSRGQAPTDVSAAPVSQSTELSEEEEAIAATYSKMKKMGLPDDAVRHKMLQDGVEPKLIASVLGEPWVQSTSASGAMLPAAAPQLSQEEEAVAATYRKMQKMGLPDDAVRHKMQQDDVAPKLIAAVFGEPWGDGTTPSVPAGSYNLKVDEEKATKEAKPGPPSLGNALGKLPQLKRSDSFETVSPTEKFAVNLESTRGAGSKKQEETKFMTLDDIARLSGQSRDELEKMIVARRQNEEQVPRFVLQPLGQDDDAVSLYPVQIASKGEKKRMASQPGNVENPSLTNPSIANVDPDHLKEVKEGEEVVDSALASAARAVSALGDGDMAALLEKLQAGDMGDLVQKLKDAEKRQKKLEKQLAQSGIAIAEDIDYEEAKKKVETIAKRMNEIGGSDIVVPDKEEQNRLREEYFKLEQEMERYNTALMISEEYQAEQDAAEKKWEKDNEADNLEALKKIRRHMPVKIRHMSEAELTNTPSPNGKFLPKVIAKKFKRTNVLQCLRLNPDDIERMHPATVEGFRVTGLTLTERRALYCHLRPIGPKWEKNKAEKMTERKWTWYKMMKSNFKENLAPYRRHVEQYGPPGNHPYATRDNPNAGCPLIGKQCPLKADKVIDYDGDYGWTDKDEYEVSQVTKADADDPGARAMQEAMELAREKKSNERADLLKKHYKGKLLQVSKANGSCEAMDESMDKMEFATMRWIEFIIEKGGPSEPDADKKKEVANFTDALNELKLALLDFCQRSGMQTSGRRKEGGGNPDIRSSVECGLAEELHECMQEFFKFMRQRMKEISERDTRVEKTIELLLNMSNELHGRSVATLKKLGVERPERSRKLRKNEDMRKEVEEKLKPKEENPSPEESGGGPPGGGAGRGRGGGRGGLMDAIAGRGGRGGRGGGRGGLLDAIAGRGRGGGRGGRGGGRGDLLSAISGRGRGGGDDGGRGGLMAAIAARGSGGGGRGGDAGGGRGGLLAAIAARGGGS